MNVALYLRRSTADLQPDSLSAQQEVLTRWARDHGHSIVATFADTASGRSVRRRDEFLRMIDVVKGGAPFEMIVVRDVSRWSRDANTDVAGMYEFICRSHGVAVTYVEENFEPDGSPYALLMQQLKRAMAAEFPFQQKRTVRQAAMRLVAQGFTVNGTCAYGLKRVLVDESGTVVGELRPGERKALSTHRVKFAPGDPTAVAVVQRIFAEYAVPEAGVISVAESLKRDGVPSPRGREWTPAMVSYVLQNEVYRGVLTYRFREGQTRSALVNVRGSAALEHARCERAHEAIIDEQTWNTVQAKLRSRSMRRTDQDLLDELKGMIRRWRPDTKRIVLPAAADLRNTLGDRDVEIIGGALPSAILRLKTLLEPHFHIDDLEGGILVDHLLHVGIASSLPHARFGSLHWSFDFARVTGSDVVLGLGFSPPPVIAHVETFVFKMSHLHQHRSVHPSLSNPTHSRKYHRVAGEDDLVSFLKYLIRFRGVRAEKVFIEAIRKHELVSIRSLADELQWPVTKTRLMYRKLSLRGVALPQPRSGRPGRRISVTCPHCFKQRLLLPETLLRLETEVCFECLHRPVARTNNRLVVTCPRCGDKRLLLNYEVKELRDGVHSLCGACNRATLPSRAQKRVKP